MALPTVAITGKVLCPDGTPPSAGTITVALSPQGSALDGATSQRVGVPVVFVLGADGSVPLAMRLVPNDVITPAGTVYQARISVISSTGSPSSWVERWQLASAPASIDIGAIPRLDVVPGLVVSLAGVGSYSTATRPAASVAYAGRLIRLLDAGVSEQLQMCMVRSDGSTYEWVTIAQASA